MAHAMPIAGAAALVPAHAAFVLAAGAAGASSAAGATPGAAGPAPAAGRRAVLMPVTGDPFKVRGTGFRARERVRVTIRPTTGDAIVRRVRATGRGTFVLAFSGVEACGGVEGVAAGSRDSHASFQFSSLTC
jgi:hypothetical protein